MTRQKTTKIIKLIEEPHHDLPMFKNRYDAEESVFQLTTDPKSVITALNEKLNASEP